MLMGIPIGNLECLCAEMGLHLGGKGDGFLSTPWVTHEAYPGCELRVDAMENLF